VPTTYRNLIGGEWVAPRSGATFTSVSPANHDLVSGFRAEVDSLHVAQGTLVSGNTAEREWVLRMTSGGAARVSMGGRLRMTTSSDTVLGTFAVPFTVTVSAP
jgi:hypothetical protein